MLSLQNNNRKRRNSLDAQWLFSAKSLVLKISRVGDLFIVFIFQLGTYSEMLE